MGTMINRRRAYGSKKQKVLFELYNQYFDGTVNSVINTGIKLWDGTHPDFKLEMKFEGTNITALDTVFVVRPDYSPYSGIRLRYNSNLSSCTVAVGEPLTYTVDTGVGYASDSYVNHFNFPYISGTLVIIRHENNLTITINGLTAHITITTPRTNNLNLLIGCDYKGTNNQTQRYFKGTINKFVLTEL